MKKIKFLFISLFAAGAVAVLVSADHIDAPNVAGSSADLADFYAFDPTGSSDNTAFIVDVQSNVMPDLTYGTFDEDVLTEINIDNDGDLVEDLVIQAIPRDGKMYFFGPFAPSQTGLNSQVNEDALIGSVDISEAQAVVGQGTGDNDGIRFFAGPRQDAFFFDFIRFNEVIDPGNDLSGFDQPGTDTFDGANTLSIAIEVPNSMLGGTSMNALGIPVYKTWVTTNRKQ